MMTPHPVTLDFNAPLTDAAEAMRQKDIGTVLVNKDGAVYGILTDRDLVLRGLVDGMNPSMTPVGDNCSREVNALRPDFTIDQAVKLMREKTVRRAPVVENGEAVGIVSIGDLAQDRDERSALAAISSAPANHWNASLTQDRSERREKAVDTRRAPLGARSRTWTVR